MKKVLSLLLAILMVVGIMAPMSVIFTGAEEPAGGDPAADVETEFPSLVITELHCNSINYNTNIASFKNPTTGFDAILGRNTGIYSAPDAEPYYEPINVAVGAAVSSYYVKDVNSETGAFTFIKAAGNAVAGTQYYRLRNVADYYDCYEYLEIYNSGAEPVNLYDYRIACDGDATYQNNTVPIVSLKPGGVKASYRKDGIEKYWVETGASVAGLYTKDGDSYVPCGAEDVAVEGTTYYRCYEDEYFVINPAYEEGVIQPGECALVWFYTITDWMCGSKLDYFKAFYEWRFRPENYPAYGVDLSDTLIIAVSANTDTLSYGYTTSTATYEEEGDCTFDLWDDGQRNYGIVPKNVPSIVDASHYTQWVSWAHWMSLVGYVPATAELRANVTVGVTDVVSVANGTTYHFKDPDTGEFLVPVLGYGADMNGKAIEGVVYYMPDISKLNGSGTNVSNKLDGTSTNFVYGYNNSVSIKQGEAYTVSAAHLTPGFLTNVQYALLPNGASAYGETSTPNLGITEVAPDCVGPDSFEYIEFVNLSGTTLNIYDYSFAVHPSSYANITNEYINKISPIVPGNVGNILVGDPNSVYYDVAPTNPDYENGWLAPGEVAILWSVYSETYTYKNTSFDDFYNFYSLDRNVKVFAIDTDNTAYSGRPDMRQNLGNSGFYLYGFIENDKLIWQGDEYTSPIYMPGVVYNTSPVNGDVPSTTYFGYSLSDCDSFVLAGANFVTCNNAGLGEGYSHQFTWNKVKGINNKLGAYPCLGGMNVMGGNARYGFTGSVVTEEWKSSPGVLLPFQKTEVTVGTAGERYVVYMEDFDTAASGYQATSSAYGIKAVDKAVNVTTAATHQKNLAATEKGDNVMLEVKDGKLYVRNNGLYDEYLTLFDDDVMGLYRQSSFTVEYDLTYLEGTALDAYASIIYDFDAASYSYGETVIRASGINGASNVSTNGVISSIEDAAATAHAASNLNGTTLYTKLNFNETDLVGETLHIKLHVSAYRGVTLTINGIEVSNTYLTAESLRFANWGWFNDVTEGKALGIKATPGVYASFDNVLVYAGSVGTNAEEIDVPELIVTEMAVGTGFTNPLSTGQNAPDCFDFIELTNASDHDIRLADYTLLRAPDADQTAGYQLESGNRAFYEFINIGDWLGAGDNKGYVTTANAGTTGGPASTTMINPSQNEAILAPGATVVVFCLNYDDGSASGKPSVYKNVIDKNGVMTDYVSAARSWLRIPDSVMTIITSRAAAKVTNGVGGPVTYPHTGFALFNNDATMVGVAKTVRTYADGQKSAPTEAYWRSVYNHDFRTLDCAINFNHSIATGQNGTDWNGSAGETGTGGIGLTGYSAHFAYGVDNSTNAKVGMLFTRRNATLYAQHNVGYIYPMQVESIRELQKLKNKGFGQDRGLVITEVIPDTDDGLDNGNGTAYDCYEAIEITNIGAIPYNLYDFAICESGEGTYGSLSWSGINNLRPGCPVGSSHKWYELVKNIKNPETCIVQPGESVVIWSWMADVAIVVGTETPTQPAKKELTVDDFRNYYASKGNSKIVEKDANGEYVVKVVTFVASDHGAFANAWNTATRAYGITLGKTISMGNYARESTVLSYAYLPFFSCAYDVQWTKRQVLNNSACAFLYNGTYVTSVDTSGKSTNTFPWPDELTEVVDDIGDVWFAAQTDMTGCYKLIDGVYVACADGEIAVAGNYYYHKLADGTYQPYVGAHAISVVNENFVVRSANGNYAFASGQYDPNETYYRIYGYLNKQTTGFADAAFNFVYGTNASGSWGVGAVLNVTKFNYRKYVGANSTYSVAENAASLAGRVQIDVQKQGYTENSLGYLIGEQVYMVSAAKFSEVGKLADGTILYLYDGVNADLSDLIPKMEGAVIGSAEQGTTIKFTAKFSKAEYAKLTENYGDVTFGIITARVEDLMNATDLRVEALELAGVTYVHDTGAGAVDFGTDEDEFITIKGSEMTLPSGYYKASFAAIAYVQYETLAGTVTVFSDRAVSRNVKQVLISAVLDYKDVQDEEYCYEVEPGVYSRYTAAQRAKFAVLCAD